MIGKLLGKKNEFALELSDAAQTEAMAPAIAPKETAPAAKTDAPAPAAPKAAPVAVNYDNTEALIAAAVQQASAEATQAATASTGTFAETYLISAGNKVSRRRPGANLASFKGMAQQMR